MFKHLSSQVVIFKFESVILNDMGLALSLKPWFSFNHSLAIIFELLRLGVLFLKCIVPVAFVRRLVLILIRLACKF